MAIATLAEHKRPQKYG